MGEPLYTNYLIQQIAIVETELQQAFDQRKSFYEIKEIVQRYKLLLNELSHSDEDILEAGKLDKPKD